MLGFNNVNTHVLVDLYSQEKEGIIDVCHARACTFVPSDFVL